jgi:hypothetical protein
MTSSTIAESTVRHKAIANASRHAQALSEAALIERQLRDQKGDVCTEIVCALTDALATAMRTAPNGKARHQIWCRYVVWQAVMGEIEDEILARLLPLYPARKATQDEGGHR